MCINSVSPATCVTSLLGVFVDRRSGPKPTKVKMRAAVAAVALALLSVASAEVLRIPLTRKAPAIERRAQLAADLKLGRVSMEELSAEQKSLIVTDTGSVTLQDYENAQFYGPITVSSLFGGCPPRQGRREAGVPRPSVAFATAGQ